MKAKVDQDGCIGCGLCVGTCAAVFSMDGVVATAIEGDVPAAQESCATAAMEECPVSVISLTAD